MTALEAIEILKTDMGCYECTFGCSTPYECTNGGCPFREAIHLAVERLSIEILPKMIMTDQTMSRCTKKNCPMQYGTVSTDCDIKDCSWRTEDAVWVKVVRCKECRHYENEAYQDGYGYCNNHMSVLEDDSFCSYGERRDDE